MMLVEDELATSTLFEFITREFWETPRAFLLILFRGRYGNLCLNAELRGASFSFRWANKCRALIVSTRTPATTRSFIKVVRKSAASTLASSIKFYSLDVRSDFYSSSSRRTSVTRYKSAAPSFLPIKLDNIDLCTISHYAGQIVGEHDQKYIQFLE